MTKHTNKKRSSTLASLGLAAALVAGASYAAPSSHARPGDRHHGPGCHHSQHHHDPQAAFQRMDQDNSGTVSQQEFVSAHEKMAEKMRAHRADRAQARREKHKDTADFFTKLDANSDGSISRAEWDEGKSRMKQAREQRRQSHVRHDHDRTDRAERHYGPRKGHKRGHHRMSAHEIFRSIDTDGNGQLTSAEFNAHHERVCQRMREKFSTKAKKQ